MKKLSSSLVFAMLCSILLTACMTKNVNIEKPFKDGKVLIKLNATQKGMGSPYEMKLSVKAYQFEEGSLSFSQQLDDFKADDVSFTWTDENTCMIAIPNNEGSKRSFKLIASPQQFQLAEVSEE